MEGDGVYCPGCGYPLDENTIICGVCGTDVAPKQPAEHADASAQANVRQSWTIAPPVRPIHPRLWVIAFGLLLSLTVLGLLVGVPLIMSELRVRGSGLPAQNLGWLVGGVVYLLFFSLFATVAWLVPSGYVNLPGADGPTRVFRAGERVPMKDQTLTVTAVDANFQSGYDFEKPSNPDDVYVLVGIHLVNNSERTLTINSMGFRLDDGAGGYNDVVVLSGMSDRLRAGHLSPHQSISGNLAFEAKRKCSKLMLHYRGNMFSGGPVSIDLRNPLHQ